MSSRSSHCKKSYKSYYKQRFPPGYTPCSTCCIPNFPEYRPLSIPTASWFELTGPLVGTDTAYLDIGDFQAVSCDLSSDGNFLAIGGPGADAGTFIGATWVFQRSGNNWLQQTKLIGSGAMNNTSQGQSCAISGDSSTLAVGGPGDNNFIGATWIFTQLDGIWSEKIKLVGTGATGSFIIQGISCSLSNDGSILAVGGSNDNSGVGATWIFTRSGTIWTQQSKLVANGATGSANQGTSCSLSSDGHTLAIGGPNDTNSIGATWIFNQSGGIWSQIIKLVGTQAFTTSLQGVSCAISGDASTLAVGGIGDNSGQGATWIFTQSGGIWTQQNKLIGSGNTGAAEQGTSCALSYTGNILAVGGAQDGNQIGAMWTFRRSGITWTQESKLVGTGFNDIPEQGFSCALSSTGTILAVGGPNNNTQEGGAWIFTYK